MRLCSVKCQPQVATNGEDSIARQCCNQAVTIAKRQLNHGFRPQTLGILGWNVTFKIVGMSRLDHHGRSCLARKGLSSTLVPWVQLDVGSPNAYAAYAAARARE